MINGVMLIQERRPIYFGGTLNYKLGWFKVTTKKYIVQIEFRYLDEPDEYESQNKTKKITIAICDTFKDACDHGNKLLETLEKRFKIHTFPDGRKAKKDRFSKTGGPFGSKNNLVSNLAYLKTPFQFFAKIETLDFSPVDNTLDEVLISVKRARELNLKQDKETT